MSFAAWLILKNSLIGLNVPKLKNLFLALIFKVFKCHLFFFQLCQKYETVVVTLNGENRL